MPTGGKATLTQFIIESRRKHPEATGDLNGLVTAVALACKAISRKVAFGALSDAVPGSTVSGAEEGLVEVATRMFMRASEWGGHLAGMLSEQLEAPYALAVEYPRGKYLLIFNPIDGPASVDLNITSGSLFSILRAPSPNRMREPRTFCSRAPRPCARATPSMGQPPCWC
jgi:fructose-1,6-bisphosphatase I / sedoheptulose-1,7-bisphosphatase